jgi:hypothetical protein
MYSRVALVSFFPPFPQASTLHYPVRIIISFMIFVSLMSSPLWAEPPKIHPYAEQLVQQALEKQLDQKRHWHLLLHYKATWLGGYESEADGMDFFNAPEGKTDPKAELLATLRNFFKDPKSLKPKEEHPQCNFPARYKWLKRELSIDPNQLPQADCSRMESWLNQLEPQSVTLIFASFYMNNPASMFGHTFLRVDSKNKINRQTLSNYGVNYAATVGTDAGILYAFKGLFGYFKGEFTIFPYYLKVQEYSNWESRDLWEYELNLTPDQIDYLMLHLWELGGTYFDYFYIQENCSYHMLTVLEAANPDLELSDNFFFSVQPADTLKVLADQEGLISKVTYRPAILSRMQHKTEQMSDLEKEVLYDLVDKADALKEDPYQQLATPQKALVLDAYLDYLEYQGLGAEDFDPKKPLKIPHDILLERSKLKYKRQDTEVTQFSSPPETAHGTDRVGLGIGVNNNELFQEFSYRPTLHDLLARDAGYTKDSQFLFMDFAGRYYYESKEFHVDRLRFLDIVSLTPYEPIFKRPSWKLNLGFDTIRDFDCGYCNSFKGNAGYGYSYKPGNKSPYILFILAEFEGETSGYLEDNFRVGGGVSGGAFIDFGEQWRLQLGAEYKRFPLGDDSEYIRVDSKLRYSPHKDVDLRLEYLRVDKNDQGLFTVNLYF